MLGLIVAAGLAHRADGDHVATCLAESRAAAAAVGAPVLLAWADGIGFACDHADLASWSGAATARRLGMDGCETVLSGIARDSHTWPVPQRATETYREGAPATGIRLPATTLHCLGEFRLEIDGAAMDLAVLRPKSRTLLQVLAANHGQFVHRETLIEAVWPGVPADLGTHRLHVAASSIRRGLAAGGCDEQPLQRSGDAYRLRFEHCDLDRLTLKLEAWQRTSSLDDPSARVAAGLAVIEAYPGELLPEAGAAEWVLPERDRLCFQVSTVALETARVAQAAGRLADGVQAAQRCVSVDPLRDTAWKLLADLQRAQGDHTAAQVTLREYGRVAAALA